MNELEQIKQKLKQDLPQIKRDYQTTQLGIFGSYIKKEETKNSGLDILVEF